MAGGDCEEAFGFFLIYIGCNDLACKDDMVAGRFSSEKSAFEISDGVVEQD